MISLATLITTRDAQAITKLFKGNLNPNELTEDLILLAIKKFPNDVNPIMAIMDAVIAADIEISGKTYGTVSEHLHGSGILLPYITKIVMLNTAIVHGNSHDILSISEILTLRKIPVPEALVIKTLKKFGNTSQESMAIIKTFIVTGGQISQEATYIAALVLALVTADKEQIISICDQLQKSRMFPLSEELIQLAIVQLTEEKFNDIDEVKKIIETVVATYGDVTEQTLLTAINSAANWSTTLLQLIFPVIKKATLSTESLKAAIVKGQNDYVIAICQKLKDAKISVTEDFIQLAIKSPKLDTKATLAIIDIVMAANKVSENTLQTLLTVVIDLSNKDSVIRLPNKDELIQPVIDAIVKTNGLTITSLQAIISAYQEKHEFGIYIPVICGELQKCNITITEDTIESILAMRISHGEVGHMSKSSQIIIEMINAAVTNGQTISEKTLIAVIKHPDKAILMRPIIDAIIKTEGSFYTKSLYVAITELIKAGKKPEVLDLLTTSLLSDAAFDSEKLTELLILLAIEKLTDLESQKFMSEVITTDAKITVQTYDALAKKYELGTDIIVSPISYNVAQLVKLNTAILQSKGQDIPGICSELQSRKTPVPEKLVIKAVEKFGNNSQESLEIIKTFVVGNGQISQMATYSAVITALEVAIATADKTQIMDICDLLQKSKMFPLSEKLLQQAILQLINEKFNDEVVKKVVETVVATGGSVTEETLLTATNHAVNWSSTLLHLIMPAIKITNNKLSIASLQAAIEKGKDEYVRTICSKLKEGEVFVPEDFITLALKSSELYKSGITAVIGIVSAYNQVSEKTLQTLLTVVIEPSNKENVKIYEELIQPVIAAIIKTRGEFTIKSLEAVILAYKKKSDLGKYVITICNELQKGKITILEDAIVSILKIGRDHSGGGAPASFEVVIEVIKAVVASGQTVSEKTLIATMQHAQSSDRAHLMRPIIDTIIQTNGKLSVASLQVAIEKRNSEYALAICAVLKKCEIHITEDSIQLAIEKLLVPISTITQSWSYSSEIKKEKEAVINIIKAIINTVVDSKEAVSETTLLVAMNNSVDIASMQPIIDAIRQTNGELSDKVLATAIEKDPKQYIDKVCELLDQRQDLCLPENLIRKAIKNYNTDSEQIRKIIKTVVVSGGKVSEQTLLAVIDRSNYRELHELIAPVIDAMVKSGNTLFVAALKAAILSGKEKYVLDICTELQKHNVSVAEEIIQFAIATYKKDDTKKEVKAVIEKTLGGIIKIVGKISEGTLLEALKTYMRLTLLQPIIDATGDNISSKALRTILTATSHWVDREIISSICVALKRHKADVKEDLLVLAIEKTIFSSYPSDEPGKKAINDLIDAVLASNNKITWLSLKTAILKGGTKFVRSFCARLETLNIMVSEEIIKFGIDTYKSKKESNDFREAETIETMLEVVFKRVEKVSEKTLLVVLNTPLKLKIVQPLIVATGDNLSSEALKTVLTTKNGCWYESPQFVSTICAILLAQQPKVPSVTEDLLVIAVEKLIPLAYQDKELVEKAIYAVIDTVVKSGNKVSEQTLIEVIKLHKEGLALAKPVINAIIKTEGNLSEKTLETVFEVDAVGKYAKDLCEVFGKCRVRVSENFIERAVNKYPKEKIINVIDLVVASGGQVTKATLLAIHKCNLREKKDLQDKAFYAYFRTGGKLTEEIKKLAPGYSEKMTEKDAQKVTDDLEKIAKPAIKERNIEKYHETLNCIKEMQGSHASFFKQLPTDVAKLIAPYAKPETLQEVKEIKEEIEKVFSPGNSK